MQLLKQPSSQHSGMITTTKVPAVDRQLIRNQMENIKMNSCVQFREMGKQERITHSLKIKIGDPQINYGGCVGKVTAGYKQKRKVILRLSRSRCSESLILHELGHVLGLAHTIKRHDRDDYVTVHDDCIKKQGKYMERQYEKLNETEVDYFRVPYMCNSIMHYHLKRKPCIAFEAKPGLFCEGGRIGRGEDAIPEDWTMIRRAHCQGL